MERQYSSKLIQQLGILAGVCKEIRLAELIDTLIRKELESKDFHGYSLGTALDALYEQGITELFFSIASQMISVNKSALPLWIEALSGNSNDKKAFRETVGKFQKQFQEDQRPYMVGDSAFYTKEIIVSCGDEIQ